MRLAVFCERMEGWNKRLTRYMRIYQECCMKNLQAEWICDKKGLLEGLANGEYDLNHVKAIEGSYVVLRNGKKLEISIRKKRETEERAASYMSKCAENEKDENLCESTGSLAKERFIC